MSGPELHAHSHAHGSSHTHLHPSVGGEDHGSLKSYLIGFFLSVILTAFPFWLVMTGVISDKQTTAIIIIALAFVQIVVHMIYFLHMNTRVQNGWSMMALIFTIVLVVIALTGSIWVMYHLNTNMMPVHDMSQVP